MGFNVTVTPVVQEVDISASVQAYEVEIIVNSDIKKYADEAKASADQAEASTISADNSADSALASATSATASANSASSSASSASSSASTATTQAGIATTQASNALASANAAAASAASAAQVGTSTLLTGFSVGSNTAIAGTDTILQAFNKTQGQINARVTGTGTSGQVSFWDGASSQSGDSGLTWDNTNKVFFINSFFNQTKTETSVASIRPVTNAWNYRANPSTPPAVLTDFHFIDINSDTRGTNVNEDTSLYSFEIQSRNISSNNVNRIVGNYLLTESNSSGNIADAVGLQIWNRTRSTGVITDSRGIYILSPTNSSTGSIVNNYAIFIENQTIGTSINYGVYSLADNFLNSIKTASISTLSGNLNISTGSGSSNILINPNGIGRVSIGTTVPFAKAHLVANTAGSIPSAGSTNDSVALAISTQSNSYGLATGVLSNGNVWMQSQRFTGASTLFNILLQPNGGSVGIGFGSGNPTNTLDVNGTGRIRNGVSLADTSGNVQIGTTTDAGFRLDVNGTARFSNDVTIADTRNIILSTTTGTRIGTATNQRLSLWNATPNVQPTNAITAAAFVANTSGIVNDTATFGGYTIGQIVAALQRIGALA